MQNNNNLKSSSHGTGTSEEKSNPNEKKRACAKWKHRFIEGFRQLWLKKWKFVFIALWGILCITLLIMTPTLAEHIMEHSTVPMIGSIIALFDTQLINEILNVLTAIVLTPALALIIYALGIPSRAKDIDADFEAVLISGKKPHYKRPFLISTILIPNTDLIEFTFYSRWLTEEDFIKEEKNILKYLECKRVVEYREGHAKYTLVIIAGKNPEPMDKGTLEDDEL